MIYILDSGDSEHDRVGQQWVIIYGHEISSSNMKKGWLRWICVVFMSNMKKGWLCKVTFMSKLKRVGCIKQFSSNMKKGWLQILNQHEKGLALRNSSELNYVCVSPVMT